ncbi:hypothetical protein SXCC_03113 [Gluconacetobacter sp. SXCC-1]|nr:hypothetical protein SXCC_03113 [Gluconacetobacter sp. SXCC-1]
MVRHGLGGARHVGHVPCHGRRDGGHTRRKEAGQRPDSRTPLDPVHHAAPPIGPYYIVSDIYMNHGGAISP